MVIITENLKVALPHAIIELYLNLFNKLQIKLPSFMGYFNTSVFTVQMGHLTQVCYTKAQSFLPLAYKLLWLHRSILIHTIRNMPYKLVYQLQTLSLLLMLIKMNAGKFHEYWTVVLVKANKLLEILHWSFEYINTEMILHLSKSLVATWSVSYWIWKYHLRSFIPWTKTWQAIEKCQHRVT